MDHPGVAPLKRQAPDVLQQEKGLERVADLEAARDAEEPRRDDALDLCRFGKAPNDEQWPAQDLVDAGEFRDAAQLQERDLVSDLHKVGIRSGGLRDVWPFQETPEI